jgi:hypothetical protein
MDDRTERDQLAEYAEALIQQIRHHADVLSASRQPGDVIPAVNSLRASARAYVRAVFGQTGWGNVFADLEGAGEEEAAGPGAPADVPAALPPLVSYRAEYKFRVHDFEAARHLLRQRSQIRHAQYCDDYDESYSGVIAGLAEMDGWKPYDYDQQVIEVVSSTWDSEVEAEHPASPANRKKARAARRSRRPR